MAEPVAKLLPTDFPIRSLGYLFPDFDSFYKELRPILGFVSINIIKKRNEDGTITTDTDWVETRARGLTSGLGILAIFIGKNLYLKFRSREYLGEQRSFVDEFLAETAFVIAEIRRKEHVWANLFRDIEPIIKLNQIETQRNTGVDKTGKNQHEKSSQSSILSHENIEQKNKSVDSTGYEQKGTVTAITEKGTNYAPLGKILSSLNALNFDFPTFYERFYHLFNTYTAPPSLQWIINKTTGRRKWVTEEEYEEIVEPEKKKKPSLGIDPWQILEEYEKTKNREKYLEALKIYHDTNEKDLVKLPETSNRKPRIENRVKIGNGLIPAYESFRPFPTLEEFRKRVNGEVDGFNKIIGYEVVIKQIERYLTSWWQYNKYKDIYPLEAKPPRQLMIALLGSPGLGKSYIVKEIAKLLGRGYSPISLNGKNSSSIIYGTDMANPGADPGEIVKAISRNKDQTTVVLFDEIEKAGLEAKQAIGNPSDRTQNYMFKDSFYDFPTPCDNVIYFAALNYPEQLPDFIADRFEKVTVEPYSYEQRIELARSLLWSNLKEGMISILIKDVLKKKPREIYDLLNQEELLKKTLTWTFSVRGIKDNIEGKLLVTLSTEFLNEYNLKSLPNDVVNYDWGFFPREVKEELDLGDKSRGRASCPYTKDKNQPHRKFSDPVPPGYIPSKCECFVNNLDKVPGWKENMTTIKWRG